MAKKDTLLSVKEYAVLFGRHSSSVYTAIRTDKLPYPVERPTGGGFLIRVPADLVAALKNT